MRAWHWVRSRQRHIADADRKQRAEGVSEGLHDAAARAHYLELQAELQRLGKRDHS